MFDSIYFERKPDLNRLPYSKRVFITYRRKPDGNNDTRNAFRLHKALTEQGFDVFYDKDSIGAGYFYTQIIDNIKVREHYVLILEPGTLDRCGQRSDWVRREIETAIEEARNIILYIHKDFKLKEPITNQPSDSGELATLNRFMAKIAFLFREDDSSASNEADDGNPPGNISVKRFSMGDVDNLAEYLLNFPVMHIEPNREIENRIPNLKQRLFVLSLKEDVADSETITTEFIKKGFDIVDNNIPETRSPLDEDGIFEQIVKRDAIILIGTRAAILELSKVQSLLYRQVRFAGDYNILIVPIIFDDGFDMYSQLPERLISLFLLNAFHFDEEKLNDLIERLTTYLTGSLLAETREDKESDENRRRGFVAYTDQRFIEGDLHFELATQMPGVVDHVKAVAHMVWGIQRLKFAPVLKLQGKADESQIMLKKAVDNFIEVTKTFPKLIITWLYKARSNIQLEDYEEALKDFTEIENIINEQSLEGINAEVAIWHSIALYHSGDHNKAYKKIASKNMETVDFDKFSDALVTATAYHIRAQIGDAVFPAREREKVESDYKNAVQIYSNLNQQEKANEIRDELGQFRVRAIKDTVELNLDSLRSNFNMRTEKLLDLNENLKSLSDGIGIAIREFDQHVILQNVELFKETLSLASQLHVEVEAGADLLEIHLYAALKQNDLLKEALERFRERWEKKIPDHAYEIKIWQKMSESLYSYLNKQKDASLTSLEEALELLQDAIPNSEDIINRNLRETLLENLEQEYLFRKNYVKASRIQEMRDNMDALDAITKLINTIKANLQQDLLEKARKSLEEGRNLIDSFPEENLHAKGTKLKYHKNKMEIILLEFNLNLRDGHYGKTLEQVDEIKTYAINKYQEFPLLLEWLCNIYKEIADAYRADQQFEQAQEYYNEIIKVVGEKSINPYIMDDTRFGLAITETWLDLDKAKELLDSQVGTQVIQTEEYKELTEAIPSDTYEAHLVRATAFQKQGDITALQQECDLAREIFAGIEKLSPNQKKLQERLDAICPAK